MTSNKRTHDVVATTYGSAATGTDESRSLATTSVTAATRCSAASCPLSLADWPPVTLLLLLLLRLFSLATTSSVCSDAEWR